MKVDTGIVRAPEIGRIGLNILKLVPAGMPVAS